MGDGTRKWYGGTSSDEISKGESDRIGIGHWAQEGIAARGVLIDYVSYADKKGTIFFDAVLSETRTNRPRWCSGMELNGMNGHAITLEEVLEIAKESNIEFKHGDILFIRSGFTRTWESISLDEKKAYRTATRAHKHKHTGLIQSEAVCRFLWENHFVACAGDGVSFEVRLSQKRKQGRRFSMMI